MGNHCCKFIDYIDNEEEYRYPKKNIFYKKTINLHKNPNLQLKTIYEDDDENEKTSIENCIIEVENNNEDINEKVEIDNKQLSYDVVSLSNDTIQYTSDNSTEIV
jgi:hypothetical protein